MTFTNVELILAAFVLGILGIVGYLAWNTVQHWGPKQQPEPGTPDFPPKPPLEPPKPPLGNPHAGDPIETVYTRNDGFTGHWSANTVTFKGPGSGGIEDMERTVMLPREYEWDWHTQAQHGEYVIEGYRPDVYRADLPDGSTAANMNVTSMNGRFYLKQSGIGIYRGNVYGLKLVSEFGDGITGVDAAMVDRVAQLVLDGQHIDFASQQSDESLWPFRLISKDFATVSVQAGLLIQYPAMEGHWFLKRLAVIRLADDWSGFIKDV